MYVWIKNIDLNWTHCLNLKTYRFCWRRFSSFSWYLYQLYRCSSPHPSFVPAASIIISLSRPFSLGTASSDLQGSVGCGTASSVLSGGLFHVTSSKWGLFIHVLIKLYIFGVLRPFKILRKRKLKVQRHSADSRKRK